MSDESAVPEDHTTEDSAQVVTTIVFTADAEVIPGGQS